MLFYSGDSAAGTHDGQRFGDIGKERAVWRIMAAAANHQQDQLAQK